MLRLTNHWRREPLIIAYLVTAVCELGAMEEINHVLQTGQVSPSVRKALDAELARHDTMDGYNWALRSERAYTLTSVREFPDSGLWLARGITSDLMLRFLDLYDKYLENGSRPYAKVVAEKSAAKSPGGRSTQSARGPGHATRARTGRDTRASRTYSGDVAITPRIDALQSAVPAGSQLVPKLTDLGLPKEVTIDPFNGEELHEKKGPDGWLVYSVGSNLIDDGGVLDSKTDIGAGPISRKVAEDRP